MGGVSAEGERVRAFSALWRRRPGRDSLSCVHSRPDFVNSDRGEIDPGCCEQQSRVGRLVGFGLQRIKA